MDNTVLCAAPGDELFQFGAIGIIEKPIFVMCYLHCASSTDNFVKSVNSLGCDAVLLDVPDVEYGYETYLRQAIDTYLDEQTVGKTLNVYTYNNQFGTDKQCSIAKSTEKIGPWLLRKEGLQNEDTSVFYTDSAQYTDICVKAAAYYPWRYEISPIPSFVQFTKVRSVRKKFDIRIVQEYVRKEFKSQNVYVLPDKSMLIGHYAAPKGTILVCCWGVTDIDISILLQLGYKQVDETMPTKTVGGLIRGLPVFDVGFPTYTFRKMRF